MCGLKKSKVNISVSRETHKRLIDITRKNETFDSSIRQLLNDVGGVNFDLLTVDGTPPETHIVEYVLGNANYKYEKGKYALVDVKA